MQGTGLPADRSGMRILLALALILAIPAVAKGPKHKGAASGPYLRPADVQIIAGYYPAQSLPPGLQKKLYRTGTLPPGWEKKIAGFPPDLQRRLPPVCATCGRGVIDGYAIVWDKKTRIIYDVAALVADVLR